MVPFLPIPFPLPSCAAISCNFSPLIFSPPSLSFPPSPDFSLYIPDTFPHPPLPIFSFLSPLCRPYLRPSLLGAVQYPYLLAVPQVPVPNEIWRPWPYIRSPLIGVIQPACRYKPFILLGLYREALRVSLTEVKHMRNVPCSVFPSLSRSVVYLLLRRSYLIAYQ